ncbi:Postreplication repair E3 ubiquitin-protein ligase-like protein [Hapsidospora chrysogenum ATCC 11550]|uniref:Postreplication repair E3 ubiquitin-protein ligase RAD18 n=1 Tax=Hapsidospora chrysogenum (strain ATCC 11550 / CBS 779.69 / DSM 880 / IAM 14645 / JCM 23072 / IMI 49137) TaxID=857340 RepID=A0A086SY82_HAPC1|nr:Postreplication repair E3 ubiquitin-protein ligase-like protein [Hapsidospora chrysogenum ATCC 11550]
MAHDDVADSTDWLSTPLSALSTLESALRCQVCKDFYETPMITSCSHTFCSLCIRRALSADNKCPLCRASEQEIRLRSNWSMEEAVEAFKKARPAVLGLARSGTSVNRSPKRKADEVEDPEAQATPKARRLRSSARLSRNRGQAPSSYAPEAEEEEIIRVSDDDDDYVPEPGENDPYCFKRALTYNHTADGLVPCPMCNRRMKEWQVFAHVESCPGPSTEKEPPERSAATLQLGATQRQHNRSLERLPTLAYSMLKENALRKKMAELGISNQGPRNLLEKRHKEWVTLWNANCDAARPKSRAELLRDLDMWERTQGGRAPTTGRAVQNAALIKDKEFDGSAWAAKHDTSFRDLIASAKKSNAQARKKPEAELEQTSKEGSPGYYAIPQESMEGEGSMEPVVPQQPLASAPKDIQRMDYTMREEEAIRIPGEQSENAPREPSEAVEAPRPLLDGSGLSAAVEASGPLPGQPNVRKTEASRPSLGESGPSEPREASGPLPGQTNFGETGATRPPLGESGPSEPREASGHPPGEPNFGGTPDANEVSRSKNQVFRQPDAPV